MEDKRNSNFLFLEIFGGPEKGRLGSKSEPFNELENLTAETVEGAALAFEGVDDVHGGDRLPISMFRVLDSVTNHVF